MSIKIPYSQVTNSDEAFSKVKGKITPDYLSQFKVSADVKYDDSKKTIKATGKGFELEMLFNDKGCDINLDLAFMLKPFKNKILEKIEDQVKQNI